MRGRPLEKLLQGRLASDVPQTLFGMPVITRILTEEPEELPEIILGDFRAYITWKLVPVPLVTLAEIELFYYDPDKEVKI